MKINTIIHSFFRYYFCFDLVSILWWLWSLWWQLINPTNWLLLLLSIRIFFVCLLFHAKDIIRFRLSIDAVDSVFGVWCLVTSFQFVWNCLLFYVMSTKPNEILCIRFESIHTIHHIYSFIWFVWNYINRSNKMLLTAVR